MTALLVFASEWELVWQGTFTFIFLLSLASNAVYCLLIAALWICFLHCLYDTVVWNACFGHQHIHFGQIIIIDLPTLSID